MMISGTVSTPIPMTRLAIVRGNEAETRHDISRRKFVTDTCRAASALALLPSIGCRRQTAYLPPNIPEYLDKRIPGLMAEAKVPGLSIAVVNDSALVWRRSYGVANVESRATVSVLRSRLVNVGCTRVKATGTCSPSSLTWWDVWIPAAAYRPGLMNGDNSGPITQALVDQECPLNELFL
jgi:hypothetical protein